MAKFAVGTWIGHEQLKNPSTSPLLNALITRTTNDLRIRGDSTFDSSELGHTVSGSWYELEQKIVLKPTVVDGRTVVQVAADLTKYHQEHQYWSVVAQEQSAGDTEPVERDSALKLLASLGDLCVADDT